jgi:hypothetical protein
MHLLRPEVDVANEATSVYALGSFGGLATIAVLAVGIAALVLAWALDRAVSTVSKVGVGILGLFGVCKLLQAFFPIDAVGSVMTTAGSVHNILGNFAFFSLPVAAFLITRSLSRHSSNCSWLLVASTVGVLSSGLIGGFGIAQRLYLVLSSLWMAFAALDLRASRSQRTQAPSSLESRTTQI